jgi:dCMP deaminase
MMGTTKYVTRLHENSPNDKWDKYFMGIAKSVGNNSKCLSRSIGAVLVKDKAIIATGYNGPPRGVPHCYSRNENYERRCPRQVKGYKSGQGLELCIAGHAERNAILQAARMGISTKGATLVCHCGVPCKDCAIEIINAGIVEVVYKTAGGTGNYGEYYDELSKYLFENSDIILRGIKYEE